jgi:hypothetical protein
MLKGSDVLDSSVMEDHAQLSCMHTSSVPCAEPFGLLFQEKKIPQQLVCSAPMPSITTHEPEETGNDGTYRTDWEDDEDEDEDEDEDDVEDAF